MRNKQKPVLNCNSHIYLYAKGHYRKKHVMNDMKRILGERSGIGEEHIGRQDILGVLFPLVYQHLKDNEAQFCKFMDNLLPDNNWKIRGIKFEDVDSLCIVIIQNCLSVLRFVPVMRGEKVILELDEPDEKILPFSPEKLDEIRRGTTKIYSIEQKEEA